MAHKISARRVQDLRSVLSQSGEVLFYGEVTSYWDCLGIRTDDVARTFLLLGTGGNHKFTGGSGKLYRAVLDMMMSGEIRYQSVNKHETVVYFPGIIIDEEAE